MKKSFQFLAIGDMFHTGKSKGAGANSDVIMWIEYRKIDKSHAMTVKQIGYGNNRMEGKVSPFSANSNVWSLE